MDTVQCIVPYCRILLVARHGGRYRYPGKKPGEFPWRCAIDTPPPPRRAPTPLVGNSFKPILRLPRASFWEPVVPDAPKFHRSGCVWPAGGEIGPPGMVPFC
ncbi:hypothetical protein MCOR02_011044 [Pyricularia oryzae]|uniref:Uncharacterized protein n=2 Tax=Pyricularia oryzae TaxID=318829 RepID=A0A4V1C657_PYROR|nr:hypothetical protein OOU_Y34scaffold00464g18 [Pyricularia oryzae Y34]KAH9428494.1 hypothetical protein MCOR02_011044 [Pyricularia oryzae]KAI6504398.1 hypothetical protein MCOR11_000022 [Pyricularia oryzae]KAI7915421.1 hypothetical protein M0657_009073 [Pyricularia oryzae]KAI7928257.1 hypothetical protein M9X92_001945 [Pyricularia oryzae]